ncbi:TPA: phage major capsid protein [Clostridioides difficile]|uniref:phage major capsid protein n=1 Tax=Clostridioides difficile TaxID=1496 RepID=UPI0010B4D265|nr:putative phage capsid protein [Clostridioides difficile]HAU5324740.1 phage major capsid protein [Clostridioides difficile]HBF0457824.1 phage major capsid protein [Clostridioides difficile]HBF2507537.1 phage major capsid protein [Clostridioides difficile]HCQ5555369.1 phage major capsid protein [Clostridioides difficile]
MTKEEYYEERQKLIDQAQKLLDEEKMEKAEEVTNKIQNLDSSYEAEVKARANLRALEDDNKISPKMMEILPYSESMNALTGEVTYRVTSQPIEKNNMYSYTTREGNKIRALSKKDSFRNALNINNSQNLSLGKYIKGMHLGDWKDANIEMEAYKALNTSTGSTLIPSELSAGIIDLARNKMALSNINVIPMETNNLTLAKVKNDPTFSFKKELELATQSDMEFEGINLKTKTVYGYMKISLELLESASNIDAVVSNAIAESIARVIDKAGLYGVGENEPKGILTYTGINKVSESLISTSKYNGLVKGIGLIKKANGEATDILYNSNTETDLNLLVDTTGQPLNEPKVVEQIEKTTSNQIKDNQAIVFDRNSILMGLQNNIRIETSREMGFTDGSVYFRVYGFVDFVVMNEKNITLVEYSESTQEVL